ncbi:isochorismatase family protein [Clostridium sp. D2Q-14]|uniref:isochorismatase family protein n=1 Tax=Anaeromonas gelatinilytica TaxID=2683194 RepID=UPI00193AECFF|nr:isochorismatase family protein [Anaeromonas gelatinilytica]MBS4535708.1 isochorismatase family protein [Anaeromonas gelatinilytica]
MKNSALLIIDVQKGLDDKQYGKRKNPNAEENILKLLKKWREEKLLVIFTKYYSKRKGSPLEKTNSNSKIKDIVKSLDNEKIVKKMTNSTFINTELHKILQSHNIMELVIVGLTTENCVSPTARNGKDLGYSIYIVSDATAAFKKVNLRSKMVNANLIHEIELICFNNEVGNILLTKVIIKNI